MLPKSERLTKEDFKQARPKVFFRGEFFDVALLPGEISKFACVISKKKVKRAVDRNIIKRRMLEGVKGRTLLKPQYIVFYIKTKALEAKYQTLCEEISKAFATLQ